MKKTFIWIVAILLIISAVKSMNNQNLIYDSVSNKVNITYDSLNRVLTKNTSSINYSYAYDIQYQGALTNISFGNNSIKYIYDNSLRIVEESRIVDGIEFKKVYYYDSSNRLVKQTSGSGQSLEYYYNEQGQIDKITGIINSTKHNVLDKPVNRTYANNLTTNFSYDSQTLRLTEIKTGAIQELEYSYDPVGNIIAINDVINNRSQTMSYDSLDRLLSMSINGGQSFVYSYNPIGNIMKIVRDSKNTTKFVYGTKPVHAPSQIIVSESGIDIDKERMLYANGSTKVFMFYVFNENNASINSVNWTVNGNPIINSSVDFSIPRNESVMVVVENNYTNTGDYSLNISGSSSAAYDFERINFTLGVKLTTLAFINNTLSNIFYKLAFFNDFSLTSPSVSWNCTDGVISSVITLSANQVLENITQYNFSSPGIKNLTCYLMGSSNMTKSIEIVIKGIEIENYNTSQPVENRKIVRFAIKNYFHPMSVMYNISSDGQSFNGTVTLNTSNSTVIVQEINYSSPGFKTVVIRINSTNISKVYNESFTLRDLEIETYKRFNISETNKIIFLDVKNYWPSGFNASWNLTDPLVVSSTFAMDANDSIIILSENNYTQGNKNPLITVYNNQSAIKTLSDIFTVKLVRITDYQALRESNNASVVRVQMLNTQGARDFSWNLDNGQQNISSNQQLTLDNREEIIAVIESDYSGMGVFPVNYRVNSSSIDDNVTGVVIIG